MWILDKIIGPSFIKLENEHGIFYNNDAYMILYSYYDEHDNRRQLAYFWEGQEASSKWWASWSAGIPQPWFLQLSGWFPILEKKLVEAGAIPPQKVRIFERKETPHFLSLFGNTIVVRRGKRRDAIRRGEAKTSLFDLRFESKSKCTSAIEVDPSSSSLNSLGEFILVTPTGVFLWHGILSPAEQRVAAVDAIRVLGKASDFIELEEGKETDEFWIALGGKLPYLDGAFFEKYAHQARLFRCSCKSGEFVVNNIPRFCQGDIATDEVFFLVSISITKHPQPDFQGHLA